MEAREHRFMLSHILASPSPLSAGMNIANDPLAEKIDVSNTDLLSSTATESDHTISDRERSPTPPPNPPSVPAGRALDGELEDWKALPPLPSEGKTRVRLNEDEKTLLIRTCYEYGDHYVGGNKDQFWVGIQRLMSKKLGCRIGNPRQTVQRMLREFEATIAIEKTASGKPLLDTDLKQALWLWKTDWDALEKNLSKEAKDAKQKDKELAVAQREAMLHTLAEKPNFQAAKAAVTIRERPGKRDGTDNPTKKEKVEDLKAKRRRIREREDFLEERFEEESALMSETLSAINSLANTLAGSTSNVEIATNVKVERMYEEIAQLKQELERQRTMAAQQTSEMLAMLSEIRASMQSNNQMPFPYL
ncbi:hypothetical protein BJ508DRAFT_324887 [Ascobolus immersus RN42]|uniref:Myb/SANT-like domain-containing protein n=1 Tax=Ascobolus immersus RN42 TaxID=1160509 RepID=A0A3N4IC18_ASCIM|nr:hypothetical protein BJ508DRAFT_324887 [Ascobolus immersus RN42]